METVVCEVDGCSGERPGHEMHSYTLCCNILDIPGQVYGSFQCSRTNHAGCCAECAAACAVSCIDDCLDGHISEPTQPLPFTSVENFITEHAPGGCTVCQQALDNRVYWIPVSYATPGHGYGAYACEDLHFCCSLEHAKIAAKNCVQAHLVHGEFEGKNDNSNT